MVIYIFTSDEIKEADKINSCVCIPTYKYIECITNIKEDTTTTVTKKTTTSTTKFDTTKTTTNSTTTKNSTISSTTSRYTTKINTMTTAPKQTTTKINTTTKQVSSSLPTTKPSTTTVKITEKTTKPIEETLININTATLEELTTLNGLGEKKANAVIEYRITNGPFKSIEDIINVSGIGKSTYEKIKDFIKV